MGKRCQRLASSSRRRWPSGAQPTIALERTPPELMGRVISFRFALVFGGMSVAMALGGVLVTLIGPQPVIFAAGVLSVAAGLGGLLVPAVRDA